MRCRGIIILLTLILISIPIIFSEDTEISPIVLENIETKEVNVIIELEEPLDELSATEKLHSANVELQQLTDTFYSAKIDEQDLQELLNDPNVQSIKNDEIFHLQLTASVPLINASIVHALQNNLINLTGRAQAICIIDSGINSTHPGLQGRILAEKCFCRADETLNRTDCCPGTLAEANLATDNHGHGTHVSGIVASNGSSIIGVAPEANIVAVKVADSSGNALFSDILLATQWCTDNSSLYNITAISMSLGGGTYTTACDDTYTSLSAEILEAWNKNISVTVSTGNSGSTSYITSPACINKTISVSSTTKADAISSFSNRNFITDLFAPGSSIISTATSGSSSCASSTTTTKSCSGTSMSTPHVAGIIALLQQYKQEIENRPLTAQEINDTLTTNGTLINDTSGSGRTFIRIDAYKALIAIDNYFPQITYTNTTSQLNYVYTNITFLANVTDIMLQSVILESNHTGNLTNYTITNTYSNQYNYTLSNTTFSSGTFQWRILANDTHGNINTSSWNNLTVYTGAPNITLYEPSNNTLTNNYSTTINFTATDDLDLTFNCTLYFNSILNQTKNVSNGSVSEFKINITDGTHTWNILCNDSHSLSTNSSTRTINIDTTEPNFISESYTSSLELGDNQTLTFVANDTYLKYVNLSYDGTNYTLENSSTTFSKTFMTLINGTNNFTTYTADYANNINDTSRNFTVRDTITGPRLMNLRYTSSVTYNSNQYITLYLIDSRTISSALLSYNGTNHTLSNNTYYNFTYTFTASTCGASTFKIFTNDTLNNAITNTTNFTVTGCCGDGICSSETCTTCSTDCGACSNTTSSSGGGGGGGGGSTTPITTTQTLDNETEITIPITTLAPETPSITDASTTTIIDQASPDNPINIKIDSTNLFISLTQNVSDIEINLKSLDTLPESLPPTKNQMFKAIEIDITNLNSSAIAYANITFQVDKNWLNNNSLDKNKVQLERYTTSWTPLATTLDSEDDNYYYFTATTPGFSYFAITTEKINESRTNWILISLGTIFLLVALILFMIHELKRNED